MRIRIRAAWAMGAFPRVDGNGWSLFGQDGGQSVDLGDGRVLFFFSDTLLAAHATDLRKPHAPAPALGRPPEAVFLPNCLALGRSGPYREAIGGLRYLEDARGFPRVILPSRERETAAQLRFWPEHGVRIDSGVYFYYLGIRTLDPTSNWGFENVGAGLARLDLESMEVQRFFVGGNWSYWSVPGDLHIGVCVTSFDGWVLVYVALREELGAKGYLIRVRPQQIEDPGAYEYLASEAPTWTHVRSDAITLGDCATEYTVRYNRYLGKYTMLYVEGLTKTLCARFADQPWGPFSPVQRLLRVPSEADVPLVYLGFEHGMFEEQEGKQVFISYSQPDFALNSSVRLTFA